MNDSARMNNRELSWLCFNERILQEARDPANPLVQCVLEHRERLRKRIFESLCGAHPPC